MLTEFWNRCIDTRCGDNQNLPHGSTRVLHELSCELAWLAMIEIQSCCHEIDCKLANN